MVKRALEKINFREEKERFNIYMAWFNLENNFGTEDDTNKVFKEALQCNDEYKVIYVYLYDQMVGEHLAEFLWNKSLFQKKPNKLLQKTSYNIWPYFIIGIE